MSKRYTSRAQSRRRVAGSVAPYCAADNQLYVDVGGVPILAADIVWTMHHGRPPQAPLLFRNGDPHDLRMDNLAERL